MLYILLVYLLLLAIIVYAVKEKELMCPTLWMICGYILSTFVAILKIKYWGDINAITVLVIIGGTISFFVGDVLGSEIVKQAKKVRYNQRVISNYASIKIHNSGIVLISIFMMYITYLYFNYTYKLSLVGGNPGGLMNMLSFARIVATESAEFQKIGIVLKYGLYFSKAYTYFILYVIMHNFFSDKQKKINIIQLIPCAIYLIQTVLSTGRTQLMYVLIYIFVTASIYIKINNNWSNKNDGKIIKRGVTTLVIILVAFWLLDVSLRGSVYGTTNTIWYTMSKYIGSSIVALDKYLVNPVHDNYFGKETLYNFYSVLNRLGFNFHLYSSPLEFVQFGDVSTNIYTALRRYFHDFGALGMIFMQLIQGLVYGYAFTKIKIKRLIGKPVLYYSMMIYPVLYNCIEERFLTNILSLPNLATVVFIFIIWKINMNKHVFQEEQ